MKIVIVGRTGTGKTSLAEALQRIGNLSILKSTTTRKPRDEEDAKRYNFITKEEADKVGAKYLYTTIGGEEYFVNDADLRTCDVAILDPDGLQDITALLSEDCIYLVYMSVNLGDDTAVSKLEAFLERHIAESDNPEETRQAITRKRQDEAERFKRLESMLFDTETPEDHPKAQPQRKIFVDSRYHGRVIAVNEFANSFVQEDMNALAMNIVVMLRRFKNMREIVSQCAGLEVLKSPEPGKIVTTDNASGQEIIKCYDDITFTILTNQQLMNNVINAWLTHDLNLGVPTELLPKLAGTIPESDIPAI